jgi:hypothetical protein
MREETLGIAPLKTTRFLSFQTHQVVVNQNKWFVRPPFGYRNKDPHKMKRFRTWGQFSASTFFPIQIDTNSQTLFMKGQWQNKCTQSSTCCKQRTQSKSCELNKIPRRWRALFVGKRSSSKRHPKIKTLEGESFRHKFLNKSSIAGSNTTTWLLSNKKSLPHTTPHSRINI